MPAPTARTLLAALALLTGNSHAAAVKSALDDQRFGLFAAAQFMTASGPCPDCQSMRQGRWYFKDDLVAVPRGADAALPGLVWLGSPQILEQATLQGDGAQWRAPDGSSGSLKLVPRIAANRSYWNAATTRFFGQRPVRMRGTVAKDGSFVARTVWPRDFVIAPGPVQRLDQPGALQRFVRAAGGQYGTRVVWQRARGAAGRWQDKPVLGIMLNGAQGDDDEAFGGHFAIATGQLGKGGEWSDWIVNNFYNLDSVSEKGIVAAPVPMDNYLMDLNSGQQYYRPSTMLVAILSQPRTAQAYQARVQRVFERFYRHEFTYRHAGANCAGISLDVFKELGWNIPQRGPTSSLKALGAYAYLAGKDLSLTSGRKIYDYLTEEQVRLYPAVAFDALGTDLLQLVGAVPGPARALSSFERQLQSDIDAVVLVTIPQIPSSRAMGSAPVFSFDEFMRRTPPERADWKIVPTAARPFPAELREASSVIDESPSPVPLPVAGIAAGGMFGVGAFMRRRRRRIA